MRIILFLQELTAIQTPNDDENKVIPLCHTISLKVPPDLFALLNLLSQDFTMSVSEILRQTARRKALEAIVEYQLEAQDQIKPVLRKAKAKLKRRKLTQSQSVMIDRLAAKLNATRSNREILETFGDE